MVFQTNNL